MVDPSGRIKLADFGMAKHVRAFICFTVQLLWHWIIWLELNISTMGLTDQVNLLDAPCLVGWVTYFNPSSAWPTPYNLWLVMGWVDPSDYLPFSEKKIFFHFLRSPKTSIQIQFSLFFNPYSHSHPRCIGLPNHSKKGPTYPALFFWLGGPTYFSLWFNISYPE